MYYHCILMSYKLAGLCRKALHKLYWYQKRTLKDGAELLQREKVTEERERDRDRQKGCWLLLFLGIIELLIGR